MEQIEKTQSNLEDAELGKLEAEFEALTEYFTNVKFAYRERESKLYFYEKLENNEECALDSKVLEQAKNNLQEVKEVYEKREEKMKVLSGEIFDLQNKLQLSETKKKELKREVDAMKMNKDRLQVIKNNLKNQNSIKEQLEKAKIANAEKIKSINLMQTKLEGNDLQELLHEENKLQEKKKSLTSRVKRMTIVNTENNMEDIYFWQKALLCFNKKLFGEIKHEISSDENTLTISCLTESEEISRVEIKIKKQKLTDIQIYGENIQKYMEEYLKIKEKCLFLNDPKLILLFVANHNK